MLYKGLGLKERVQGGDFGLCVRTISWEQCSVVGIDMEHHHRRSYRGVTCLIQLGTAEYVYVIDALKLFDHLHILYAITANPTIVKDFHNGDNDIAWLQVTNTQ